MHDKNKQITGVIYRTTNLVDGKWYIGKDETNNPDYLGSGIVLSRAIAKHGRHCFRKEILAEASTRAELAELEKQFISLFDATANPMSYNIASGGNGGNTLAGLDNEQKEAFSQKLRDRWANMSYEQRTLFIDTVSKAHKGKAKTKEHRQKISQAKIGRARDAETKRKIKDTLKEKYARGDHFVPKHEAKCTPEQIAEMKQAYLMGTPVSILQQKYQLSRTTIYKYIKDCR